MTPLAEWVVSMGFVAYLTFAWGWTAPDKSRLKRWVMKVRKPLLWLGLWHSWNVFLPDPPRADARLGARIWFDDGSNVIWQPPHLGRMSLFRAFLSMRGRKFYRNLLLSRNRTYRGPFCRHLAVQYHDTGRSPSRIDLLHYVTRIAPPPPASAPRQGPERYVIHVERFG